jgi:hypothetical protein
MIKILMCQEDLIILNLYAPSSRLPRRVRKKWIGSQKEMNNCTIHVVDFNTTLSALIKDRKIILN